MFRHFHFCLITALVGDNKLILSYLILVWRRPVSPNGLSRDIEQFSPDLSPAAFSS